MWYEENTHYHINKAEVFLNWGEHKYKLSFFLYTIVYIFWNFVSEK